MPLALMALGTSASTCETVPDAAAADDELLGEVGLVLELLELLELLEHPAATSVVTTAAISAPAATLLGPRRATDTICLVRLFPT
jgi:hypothetical protein